MLSPIRRFFLATWDLICDIDMDVKLTDDLSTTEDLVAYRPYTDNRFYPGLISEERQAQLAGFDFALKELTGDDLVWHLSKSVAATAYAALRWVRDKFGQDAAQELAREFGYESGVAIFNAYRQRIGVAPGEALTPEQFAEFQDYSHATMGVDAVYSFSGYDNEKAWVSRQRCFFGGSSPFTNAPADLHAVCAYADLGFISAYKELQPQLLWRNTHNMADHTATDAAGQAICGSIMWMDIPEGIEERSTTLRELATR
jgi:hypothetical protein